MNRIEQIRERSARLRNDSAAVEAPNDAERAYENAIRHSLDDIDFLLSEIDKLRESPTGRCGVSYTGKHEVDAPYCKSCGQEFALSLRESGSRRCVKCGHEQEYDFKGIHKGYECYVGLPPCGCKCVFEAVKERKSS